MRKVLRSQDNVESDFQSRHRSSCGVYRAPGKQILLSLMAVKQRRSMQWWWQGWVGAPP